MNTLKCPHCSASLSLGLLPAGASDLVMASAVASGAPPGAAPERRKPGRKPKPKPAAPQDLANAAVHNWLTYGVPLFRTFDDGYTPPWGRRIPAADVFYAYTDWALHNGVRIIASRPLYQALKRFGVAASRDGHTRFHVFPEDRPAALDEVPPPCPRLQPVEDWPFPPQRLPWVEDWLSALSRDPRGPWQMYVSTSESFGWVNVERATAIDQGLWPAPSWWPAAAPVSWLDTPVAPAAVESAPEAPAAAAAPAFDAGGVDAARGPGLAVSGVVDGGVLRRSVFAPERQQVTVVPPQVWP